MTKSATCVINIPKNLNLTNKKRSTSTDTSIIQMLLLLDPKISLTYI